MTTLPDAILLPVFLHLCLVLYLFIMVSVKRNKAVTNGVVAQDDFAHKSREPEHSRRWVNNLNNQFELPLYFYSLVALLYATDAVTFVMVALAWLFLVGRLIHTVVQVTGDNVRLRGLVFTINFSAVVAMWALFIAGRWGLI